MPERQPIRAANDDILQVDTPVIDMQDVEHQESGATRVNTRGLEVTAAHPSPVEEALAEVEHDLDEEDQKIREAIAEFEQEFPKAPPR